ncbi:MAG: Ig-like domain-containing protein, partial [Halobacteriota archaeon]|nr:Ig-like domain-containing protein [Halobacteriota archaeon]
SSDEAVGTVGSNGLFTAVGSGSTTVSATNGAVSDGASVSVADVGDDTWTVGDGGVSWNGNTVMVGAGENTNGNIEIDLLEDFTKYTEFDSNSHLTVETNHLELQGYDNEDCYLYKDYGVDHFGDFKHFVDVQLDESNNDIGVYLWGLQNDINDVCDLYNEEKTYLGIQLYGNSEYIELLEIHGDGAWKDSYDALPDTPYYLTIEKSGTYVTCKIYSDSGRTNLLDTLSLESHTDHKFRYMFAANTWNSGNSYNGIINVDNLNLGETTSGDLITYHDAGPGMETVSFSINANTQADTSYAVYYRENGTGSWSMLDSGLTGSNTVTIPGTKYQNTDVKVQLSGNGLNTPEIISITYNMEDVGGAPPVLTTIEVLPESASLSIGETEQFTATGYDQYGSVMTGVTFTWDSSDEAVGTVGSNGLFTAVGSGSTTVSATNGAVSDGASVSVAGGSSTTTYDFATGAGTDKWAYGYEVNYYVECSDTNPGDEITSSEYNQIASDDNSYFDSQDPGFNDRAAIRY